MGTLKQEVDKYDKMLAELKQHQLRQDTERESSYKAENQRLKQHIVELNSQLNQFDISKRFEVERSQKDKNSLHEELRKLSQQLETSNRTNDKLKTQILELTSDCQSMQRMYRILEENNEKLKLDFNDKNEELKNVLSQSNNFQTSNYELALQVKQLEDELMRVGKSKETIESAKAELLQKFNEYGRVIQEECEDKIETLKRSYKEKKEKLVEKIMSQKFKIDDFEHQKREYISHTEHVKLKYEETIDGLKDDIKRVKHEWESKLYYQDLEYQKKITEAVSRHKLEIAQMEAEMRKAYDENLKSIESDAQAKIDQSRQDAQKAKKELDKKNKECIQIDRHEEILRTELEKLRVDKNNELQTAMEEMQNELYDKIEQLENELEHSNRDNSELHQALGVEKDTVRELGLRLQDLDHKIKELNQKCNELLQENGSLKSQLEDDYKIKNLENKVRELHALSQENSELRGKYFSTI